MELGAICRFALVLEALHHAHLQRGVQLAPRHRRGVSAEKLHAPDVTLRLRDPDLQALHVRQAADRGAAREDLPEGRVVDRQGPHLGALENGAIQLLTDGPIQHPVNMVEVAEQVGELGHRPDRDLISRRGGVEHAGLQDAEVDAVERRPHAA